MQESGAIRRLHRRRNHPGNAQVHELYGDSTLESAIHFATDGTRFAFVGEINISGITDRGGFLAFAGGL